MDFIEGIGERYLMGKANAAPGMIENFAKKQFSSASNPKAEAAQSSTLPSSEKDDEIAKLRKELAETKLNKDKSTGGQKTGKSKAALSRPKAVKSEKGRPNASQAKNSGGSAKEMKGPTPLSIGAGGSHAPSESRSEKKEAASRGRSASISTATAAKAHKALSEAKSGVHSSKPGKQSHGLEASSALHAHNDGSVRRKAAPSASSSVYAPSSVRGHSMDRHSEYLDDEVRSNAASLTPSLHSMGRKSRMDDLETRSNASTVTARPPPPPPAPASMHHAPHSERGSVTGHAMTRSPPPPPPSAPPSVHGSQLAKKESHSQALTKLVTETYEVEESETYIIEVEEDRLPMRKNKRYGAQPVRKDVYRDEDGGKGDGVVEVMKSSGRTVYRVC